MIKVIKLQQQPNPEEVAYDVLATSDEAEAASGSNPFGTADVDVQFWPTKSPGYKAAWKVSDVTDDEISIRKEAAEGSGGPVGPNAKGEQEPQPQARMVVRKSPEKVSGRIAAEKDAAELAAKRAAAAAKAQAAEVARIQAADTTKAPIIPPAPSGG